MSSKVFVTPISRGNQKANNNFKYELDTDQLPMRWSAIRNKQISTDIKYIGFAYYNRNNNKILVVYNIIAILPHGTAQREHWGEEYQTAQTILIGDLNAVMTLDRYSELSLKETGEEYECKTLPRSNQIRNIDNTLLNTIDETLLVEDYNFNNTSLAKNSHIANRTEEKDRYELIFKAMLEHEFPNFRFLHNAYLRMPNGKIRRPDFHRNFEHITVIIEYDEHNHNDRKIDDEIERMNQLRDCFRPRKTVFIRYGNANKSWDDARKFIRIVKKTTFIAMNKIKATDKIILIGYPSNPYNSIIDWEIDVL